MGSYKKEEVMRGLDVPFQPDVFTVRITDMKKGKSGQGNLQIVTDCEIIDPPSAKTADGSPVVTAGLKFKMYCLTDPSVAWGIGKLVGALERAGLPPKEIQGLEEDDVFNDDPEPLRTYVGKTFNMSISCDPRPVMRKPTPEEAATGKKAEPLTVDGKAVTNGYQLKVDWQQVTGPATGGMNSPY